jgi:hypothetical protein
MDFFPDFQELEISGDLRPYGQDILHPLDQDLGLSPARMPQQQQAEAEKEQKGFHDMIFL